MSSIAQIGTVSHSTVSALRQRLEEGLEGLRGLLATLGPQSKPEQIHDIRVAARRLQVLCPLLQLEGTLDRFPQLARPLKKLIRALSSVRSWDVSAQLLKSLERQWHAEGKKRVGFLRKLLKKQTRRSRRRDLEEFPVDKFIGAMDPREFAPYWSMLSGPTVERRILDRVGESSVQALEKWRQYERTQAITDFHQFRIALKQLRYIFEIQAGCMGHPNEEGIGALKSLQDNIGYIHDLHVLRCHLGKKAIRKRIPIDKKKPLRRIEKLLKQSQALALEGFKKNEGARWMSLLQEIMP